MLIKQPIQQAFVQITEVLNQLSSAQYTQPSRILSNASIGQHVRHIIELFQCLEMGYISGTVNYEKRKRDLRIETDKELAMQLMREIYSALEKPDIPLMLEAEDYCESIMPVRIQSNYYREIVFNLEHTIHHMALIRVGVNEVSDIQLPDEFGVANSTIKIRQQCAQ